jgi:hypothetical protein
LLCSYYWHFIDWIWLIVYLQFILYFFYFNWIFLLILIFFVFLFYYSV